MFSMNIIYIDTLFLVNFISDYVILLCTAKVTGSIINRKLIIFSSILGSCYACICAIHPDSFWNVYITKIIAMVLLCLITFKNESALITHCITFLMISFIVGGLFSSITVNIGHLNFTQISIRHIIAAFCTIYILLTIYFRNIGKDTKKEFHTITIIQDGQTVTVSALKDTGNDLFDPISNAPVIICQASVLPLLFPNIICESDYNDPPALFRFLSQIPSITTKARLIPYHTIGNKGLLAGFKPDVLQIDGINSDCILAFSPKQFTPNNTYQALY